MDDKPGARSEGREQYFQDVLGAAVVAAWGTLPRDAQEMLFEAAVATGSPNADDATLREQLALFLHDRHPRTDEPAQAAAPDPAGRAPPL